MANKWAVTKNNKLISFIALGGIATSLMMQTTLMTDTLLLPNVLLAAGAVGLGKWWNELAKANGIKPSIIKSTFLGAGAVALTMAVIKMNHHISPITLFAAEAFVVHCAINVFNKVYNKKTQKIVKNVTKTVDENFITPAINKTKESIVKIREKNVEQELKANQEFKPLDISKM